MTRNIQSLAGTSHTSAPEKALPGKFALSHNPASSGDVVVEILAPAQLKKTYSLSTRLCASAKRGSEDISGEVRWRSDIDGFLGRGAVVTTPLSEGQHVLSAKIVEPKRTLRRSANANITVTALVTVCADPNPYAEGDTCS